MKRSHADIERYDTGIFSRQFSVKAASSGRFITGWKMSAVVLVRGPKSHFDSQQVEENGYLTKVSCTVVARIK